MEDFQENDASNGLLLLENSAAGQETDLNTFNSQQDVNISDEETNSCCPIFDSFMMNSFLKQFVECPILMQQIMRHCGIMLKKQ